MSFLMRASYSPVERLLSAINCFFHLITSFDKSDSARILFRSCTVGSPVMSLSFLRAAFNSALVSAAARAASASASGCAVLGAEVAVGAAFLTGFRGGR